MILGIETSCDDTSAAVLHESELLSNVISTQLVHRQFGGIVPELASRSHVRNIVPVIREALESAGVSLNQMDAIAVTYGPGLAGSLLVGLSTAKGLAQALNIPMIGVNHLEGHIRANALEDPNLEPPFLTLVVSGGHTQLVHVRAWGEYRILGATQDDAAGEAFDKVAKLLGLGFPGGPVIEKTAKGGDPKYIRFPRANLKYAGPFDFSFSGLKTAVLHHVRKLDGDERQTRLSDIARCFQEAVVDVLVSNTLDAARKIGTKRICLAGGVAVNGALRDAMRMAAASNGLSVGWPSTALCTDNAAMIASAGEYYYRQHQYSDTTLAPKPSVNL